MLRYKRESEAVLRYEQMSGCRAKIRTGVMVPCYDTNGSQGAVVGVNSVTPSE